MTPILNDVNYSRDVINSNAVNNDVIATNNSDVTTIAQTSTRCGVVDAANITGNRELYEVVASVLYTYGLPGICVCGFFGNLLNLVILAGRRMRLTIRRSERTANIGLNALAFSDMAFCLAAFPSTFLPPHMTFDERGFLAFYGCFCAAIINVFIMTSTWLTVTMSTERYLAVRYPLRIRELLTIRRVKGVTVAVFVISAIFNIPVFWRNRMVEFQCVSVDEDGLSKDYVGYRIEPYVSNETFDHVYRGLWAVVGNLIPLAILLICNVGLVREIQKSYAMRERLNSRCSGRTSCRKADVEANHRITITLTSIVVMFLVLVAPWELIKQVVYLVDGELAHNYTYLTIEVVTNLMQTINFSANFILYCIVNPSFRRTIVEIFCYRGVRRMNSRRSSAADSVVRNIRELDEKFDDGVKYCAEYKE